MLSVANEAATHEENARTYFQDVISYTRSLSSLPITIVEFTKFDDGSKVADLVDVIAINRYYGWYTDHGIFASKLSKRQQQMLELYVVVTKTTASKNLKKMTNENGFEKVGDGCFK